MEFKTNKQFFTSLSAKDKKQIRVAAKNATMGMWCFHGAMSQSFRSAWMFIAQIFVFSNTPQGFDFWDNWASNIDNK